MKKRTPTRHRAYTLMELLVIIAITGVFIAATAPIMQEIFTSLNTIQKREARSAVETTWTNHLRADLWAGRQVTLQTPDNADIILPAAHAALPPVVWMLNPQAAITRTTAPTPDSDGQKTFHAMAHVIHAQRLPGALRLSVTQADNSQPSLYVLPLQPGAKP